VFAARLDPDLPTLIGGDFNESTSTGATEMLAERGFVDALHEIDPDARTWRWPTSVGDLESALDRVLVRPRDGLEPIDAEVLKKGRSDHLPVVTVFELPAS
jgi:endonuclease/exonuclease/phosphatase family metal-dependent hydrolase